jgi:hypothetical protein
MTARPIARLWHHGTMSCYLYKSESGWWVALLDNEILIRRHDVSGADTAIATGDDWGREYASHSGLLFALPSRSFTHIGSQPATAETIPRETHRTLGMG